MIRQYPLPLPHQEAMEAADFMVTASNREARTWVEQWPEWPTGSLVIYGPSGSGKTHLAQVWQRRSNAVALSLDELHMQNAGSTPSTTLIDNADKIIGTPALEEALFHLYNRLRANKRSLLLTSSLAPAQWGIALADLRSRLATIPAVALAAPDDELLSALIIKQFRDRQIDLGMDVVEYLLPRIERSPAAIRTIVHALDQTSIAEKRRITVALARKLLEDQGFLN